MSLLIQALYPETAQTPTDAKQREVFKILLAKSWHFCFRKETESAISQKNIKIFQNIILASAHTTLVTITILLQMKQQLMFHIFTKRGE